MSDYLFASGAIKSLEVKVLDRKKIYRLINVEKKDFVKTLFDMGYGTKDSSLDNLIESEMDKVKKTILFYSPNEELTRLFFIANDSQNLKLLLKNKQYQIFDNNEVKLISGGIENNVLITALNDSEYEKMPKQYLTFIKDLQNKVSKIDNAKQLSNFIDQQAFRFALDNAHGNKIIQTYFKSKIDYTNVLTFMRTKKLGWDLKQFSMLFIDGGFIKKENFTNAYEKEMNSSSFKWLKEIDNEKLYNIIVNYLELKDINRLEKDLENLLINIMSQYKNDANSIGPMIYYYIEKLSEAKNIRIVYASEQLELTDLLDY